MGVTGELQAANRPVVLCWKWWSFKLICNAPAPAGGSPIGFDVGAKGAGGTLPGLDLVGLLLAWSCCSVDTARGSLRLHLAMPCRWCAQCE